MEKDNDLINKIKIQSDNSKNIREIKAELIQKKYGSTVNVNEFFTSYTNQLSNFAEKINLNEIETYCEDDCTIVKITPQITEDNYEKWAKSDAPSQKIEFGDESEKIGYKSFEYICNFTDNKLILETINNDEIVYTGNDISVKIKEILEKINML
jgi:hypothetical protein